MNVLMPGRAGGHVRAWENPGKVRHVFLPAPCRRQGARLHHGVSQRPAWPHPGVSIADFRDFFEVRVSMTRSYGKPERFKACRHAWPGACFWTAVNR